MRTLFIVRNNQKQQKNKTRGDFRLPEYRIRVCSSIPHILQNDVITGTLFLLFCMHNQHLISNQPILFTLRILFTLFPFLSHQRDYCSLTTNCSFRVMFNVSTSACIVIFCNDAPSMPLLRIPRT